jgi:hypothetical protein
MLLFMAVSRDFGGWFGIAFLRNFVFGFDLDLRGAVAGFEPEE